MAAPEGNKYYLLRKKERTETKYTPDELLEKANEYFQWCIDNPLEEDKTYHFQGSITRTHEKKMRAFSIQGFANFAEIVKQTFLNYESSKDDDMVDVCTRIRGIIEMQQFEGATAGFLNPSIIATKLGLEKKLSLKMNVVDVDFTE